MNRHNNNFTVILRLVCGYKLPTVRAGIRAVCTQIRYLNGFWNASFRTSCSGSCLDKKLQAFEPESFGTIETGILWETLFDFIRELFEFLKFQFYLVIFYFYNLQQFQEIIKYE